MGSKNKKTTNLGRGAAEHLDAELQIACGDLVLQVHLEEAVQLGRLDNSQVCLSSKFRCLVERALTSKYAAAAR